MNATRLSARSNAADPATVELENSLIMLIVAGVPVNSGPRRTPAGLVDR
ncbi:MAG TPA: hypothetical protein VFZ37_00630 [Jiangellaceae bacterium]